MAETTDNIRETTEFTNPVDGGTKNNATENPRRGLGETRGTTIYHAVYYANELGRKRSFADQERMASVLSDAMVDLNPHQIDAALFGFKSPLSKGVILADEVGLGKTIEAGLIISQRWAEGKRKILIIVPANLRKQWLEEMVEKFHLKCLLLEQKNFDIMQKKGHKNPFDQRVPVICSYHFASKHSDLVLEHQWDLAVIDEAHRLRNVYKPGTKMAKEIKKALMNRPKVLLTATPLQNSMMELFGLVSVIDDHAFGDIRGYKSKYARLAGKGSVKELKQRLAPICRRTLRRQVLEYIKFTNRVPLTQDFFPSEQERELYNLVSEYLQRDEILAIPRRQQALVTLIMRKLLASSPDAIAGGLTTLIERLKELRSCGKAKNHFSGFGQDYESFEEISDELDDGCGDDPCDMPTAANVGIEREIAELERFRDLAVSIKWNSKGTALLKALEAGFKQAEGLGAAAKAVIFTESRKTQDYLFRHLSVNGYEGKIVLFNGTNADAHSREIYQNWLNKHSGTDKVTGSRAADTRAALADYFREEANIMISTEAGAEGANLQFCSIVVNYDLPWNPQRVEQRIGRCHRYGQKHDVVVINFINRRNAADQRVFELLDQKFKLFSGVFGVSDEVLGAIESGFDFEKRISAIYQKCRTPNEIEKEFDRLQKEMDRQIKTKMANAKRKLIENFDEDVRKRLRVSMGINLESMNRFDHMLWNLARFGLKDKARFDEKNMRFEMYDYWDDDFHHRSESPKGVFGFARAAADCFRFRIGHPAAQMLINHFRDVKPSAAEITFDFNGCKRKPKKIARLVGMCGTMALYRMRIKGADEHDKLIFCALTNDGKLIPQEEVEKLFELPAKEVNEMDLGKAMARKSIEEMARKIGEEYKKIKLKVLREMNGQSSQWFEEESEKLDYWASDNKKGLRAQLQELELESRRLRKTIRMEKTLSRKVFFQKQLLDNEKKRDKAWRKYDSASLKVDKEREELLDQVEMLLKQETEDTMIFMIDWKVV